jgi:hypothetical protein
LLRGNVEWNPGPQSGSLDGAAPVHDVNSDEQSGDEPLARRAAMSKQTTTHAAAAPSSQAGGRGRRKTGGEGGKKAGNGQAKTTGGPGARRGVSGATKSRAGQKRTPGRKAGTSILDGISATRRGSDTQGRRSTGAEGEVPTGSAQSDREARAPEPTSSDGPEGEPEEEDPEVEIANSCWNAALRKVGQLSDKSKKDYDRGLKVYKVRAVG